MCIWCWLIANCQSSRVIHNGYSLQIDSYVFLLLALGGVHKNGCRKHDSWSARGQAKEVYELIRVPRLVKKSKSNNCSYFVMFFVWNQLYCHIPFTSDAKTACMLLTVLIVIENNFFQLLSVKWGKKLAYLKWIR